MLLTNTPVNAQHFKTAVSPDFPNGLHSKYIAFISKKLSIKADITLLPFPRKIKALKDGKLDLVIGIQKLTLPESETLIYVSPPYQSYSSTLFVKYKNKETIAKYQHLSHLIIGVSERAKYFDLFDKDNNLAKVQLPSLSQKIKLLTNGRIDAFFHNGESAELTLKEMGLADTITRAKFQPEQKRHYYVAISKQSFLVEHLDLLKKIVISAKDNGDLQNIRKHHYSALIGK